MVVGIPVLTHEAPSSTAAVDTSTAPASASATPNPSGNTAHALSIFLPVVLGVLVAGGAFVLLVRWLRRRRLHSRGRRDGPGEFGLFRVPVFSSLLRLAKLTPALQPAPSTATDIPHVAHLDLRYPPVPAYPPPAFSPQAPPHIPSAPLPASTEPPPAYGQKWDEEEAAGQLASSREEREERAVEGSRRSDSSAAAAGSIP